MPAAYTKVLEHKNSLQGRFMVMCVGPSSELRHAQIGVITARRTLKTAVERNRARRLVREAFRTQQKRIQPGARIICIARKILAEGRLSDVARDLKILCLRAGLWIDKPRKKTSAPLETSP